MKVLIIDDEEKLRSLLSRIISIEGFEVFEAGNGKDAFKKLSQFEIDIVLCDVKLPDINGVELSKNIKEKYPNIEIIILTAYGNIPDGVQAIKNGAFDYIIKGDDNNKIIPLIKRAFDKARLQKRVNELENLVGQKFSFDSIIGKSKSILQAIEMAKKVAPNDTTVLLTGETGTGKEVFAQAIHQESKRKGKSFVAVNCGAFSKELLESELFGYKQGAFTGAVKDKKGLIEEANLGTLFLDEIGEIPIELQAKLLRIIETGEFIKIGDTKASKSNFRLIAATNKDLKLESEEKRFRPDLYFRLNIFQIQLPPLRERIKDIEELVKFSIPIFCEKTNKKPLEIDNNFLAVLEKYSWPGNIRELMNVIERCVILAEGNQLSIDLLPNEIRQSRQYVSEDKSVISMFAIEKSHILSVLKSTEGNKAEAARLLEISIATLYRKLEEYKLS